MLNRKDVNMLQFTHEHYYEESHEINTEKNGLALAFALFDYYGNQDLDPSYGELIFNVTEWNFEKMERK